MTKDPIQFGTFDIFKHVDDLRYKQIQFKIPIHIDTSQMINDHSLFKNDLIKYRIQYIDTSLDIFENMHDLEDTQIQFKIPILRLLII